MSFSATPEPLGEGENTKKETLSSLFVGVYGFEPQTLCL